MSPPIDISVLIPTFNRSDLLPRALDSVFAQRRPPGEVIVVDDGSTDETAALVQRQYPKVTYLHQSNVGVSGARNYGIRTATGSWIAFLDSDDEWLPDKLSRQGEALSENPEIKICHTDEIWIRNGRRVNPKKKHAKSGGWIFQKCLPLCCISPSSVVIHRSVFDTVGLLDETLPVCEDYDLWLRITPLFPVLYMDEPLIIKYGGHHDQLSQKFWGMDRFRIRALDKIVRSGILSDEDSEKARSVLTEKLAIYLKGARKHGRLNFVVALPSEAEPIIQHFGLFLENGDSRFKTYRSDDGKLWLVVSGIGKDLAAAATTFLAAQSEADRQTAWLNVGTGGHADLPVGTPVLAYRVTDAATEQSWHPPIIFEPSCETISVTSVDRPVEDYPGRDVYEMEAAGFYARAIQISSSGRVQVLKVISDNPASPVERITAARVTQLMSDRLGEIEQIVHSLKQLPYHSSRWDLAAIDEEMKR